MKEQQIDYKKKLKPVKIWHGPLHTKKEKISSKEFFIAIDFLISLDKKLNKNTISSQNNKISSNS